MRVAPPLRSRIAKERDLTLLFTDHDMDVVFSIAHTIAVLHQGRMPLPSARRKRFAAKRKRGTARLPRGRKALHFPARSRRHPHGLWQQPGSVRNIARNLVWPVRVSARPQRRRQYDDHAFDHGADAALARSRALQGHRHHLISALPAGAALHFGYVPVYHLLHLVLRHIADAAPRQPVGRRSGDVVPLKRTRPCEGGVRPMIERMVVVLPTPLRPSRQTHSPGLMSSDIPNRTRLLP